MTTDTIRECVDCGVSIHLTYGLEWLFDEDDTRCWGCQQDEIERLRGAPSGPTNHCVCDSSTGTVRCKICGDEIPIPLGDISWVCGVLGAFTGSHPGVPHEGKRTYFQRGRMA